VDQIGGAELLSNVGTELTYRLPMDGSAGFPRMMAHIEDNKDALGIVSYGIGVTTMEEVFLRVAVDSASHSDTKARSTRRGMP
jgi:ATP-binding cassette, subfamily A (ABC1), member 3